MPSSGHLDIAGPSEATRPSPSPARGDRLRAQVQATTAATFRLRKHADYQRVYAASRKQFSKQMSYFFLLRLPPVSNSSQLHVEPIGPRVGLTVGKVMGKAVDRNRIKRRMREAVRRHLMLLRTPVDVVLHPRRSVIDLDFAILESEVAAVFRAVQRAAEKQVGSTPPAAK